MEWIVEPLVGPVIHADPVQAHPTCPTFGCVLSPCPPWNCGCIMQVVIGPVHPISG
jgi:hypothetical protein